MKPGSKSSSRAQYSRSAIGLHWLIALLMVCGFYLGWIMTDIPGITPTKLKYFSWHKWIGVTVFALAIIRVLWRVRHKAPSMPRRLSGWQKGIPHLAHSLLHPLRVTIPLTGD